MSKTLVAYFSASGVTAKVAERLSHVYKTMLEDMNSMYLSDLYQEMKEQISRDESGN
ncbi:flavodoxin [Oribacterium sp. HCP28S3_H8]|uniref:flavodoxin n=1 Tax=Oribacterium sp. HCP28S3_H8 TaxID=3438945 RepID=UPI003F88E452